MRLIALVNRDGAAGINTKLLLSPRGGEIRSVREGQWMLTFTSIDRPDVWCNTSGAMREWEGEWIGHMTAIDQQYSSDMTAVSPSNQIDRMEV